MNSFFSMGFLLSELHSGHESCALCYPIFKYSDLFPSFREESKEGREREKISKKK